MGHGDENILELTRIPSLSGHHVVKVTAGWDFSCIVTGE